MRRRVADNFRLVLPTSSSINNIPSSTQASKAMETPASVATVAVVAPVALALSHAVPVISMVLRTAASPSVLGVLHGVLPVGTCFGTELEAVSAKGHLPFS